MAVPDREPPRAFPRHAGAPADRAHRHAHDPVGDGRDRLRHRRLDHARRRGGGGRRGGDRRRRDSIAAAGPSCGSSPRRSSSFSSSSPSARWSAAARAAWRPTCSPSRCSWSPRASATAGSWWGRRSAPCSCWPRRSASTRPTSSHHPSRSWSRWRSSICAAVYVSPLVASDVRHRADSTLDQLTGLLNRRALGPRFAEIAEQAALTDQPVSVVLADLDHFKSINDDHGHGVGDAVLRDVAYAMRRVAADLRAALPPRRRGVRAAAPGRGRGRRGADRREPARRDRGARDRRPAGHVLVRRGHRPRREHRARAPRRRRRRRALRRQARRAQPRRAPRRRAPVAAGLTRCRLPRRGEAQGNSPEPRARDRGAVRRVRRRRPRRRSRSASRMPSSRSPTAACRRGCAGAGPRPPGAAAGAARQRRGRRCPGQAAGQLPGIDLGPGTDPGAVVAVYTRCTGGLFHERCSIYELDIASGQ